MCGIAGFVDLVGGRELAVDRLDAMVEAMFDRGPDGRGTSRQAGVALGMRRLSIIDLAGGQQPIENEDGRIRVVMNGELYNHEALQRELEAAGHRFRSRSDTEVLVHGYEEWGIDGLLARLNGMFAFALQDERRETVFLARDRLGIKPLLYAERDGWLLFGSSHDALLASGLVEAELDFDAVELYLLLQYVPGTYSPLRSVQRLAPGHLLEVRGGQARTPRAWWSLPSQSLDDAAAASASERRSDEDLVAEARELLADAVRMHMVSDVEVGVFLSGGLDSTLILGLMREATDNTIRAYSIGFEDQRVFDESAHARAAAERFGATYVPQLFTAQEVLAQVDVLTRVLDEPIGDAACLPTLLLSELARRDLKVVLSGEGADELFAGYGYYQDLPPRDPGFVRNFDRGDDPGFFARAFKGAKRGTMTVQRSFHGKSAISGFPYAMSPDFIAELVRRDTARGVDAGARIAQLEAQWQGSSTSPLQRALRVDASSWLPDDLLMKVDRTTMAHSLEARVPFLDWRVANFAFSLPARLKLSGTTGKAILRRAFAPLLGERFEKREKHGFNLPMHAWMRNELRDRVHARLVDACPNWLDRPCVAALLEAHHSGRASLERSLWSLFVLVSWHERARERVRAAALVGGAA